MRMRSSQAPQGNRHPKEDLAMSLHSSTNLTSLRIFGIYVRRISGKTYNTHTRAPQTTTQWQKTRSSALLWSRRKEFPGPCLINFIEVYGLPSAVIPQWFPFSKEELMLVKSLRAALRFPEPLVPLGTLARLISRASTILLQPLI